MKLLMLGLDGTVRQTKSGTTFITDPLDQELTPGVDKAIERYEGYAIIGITNQLGVMKGYKTFEDCVAEQRETLRLAPKLGMILFCPDEGAGCYCVGAGAEVRDYSVKHFDLFGMFRKPGAGMLVAAMRECGGAFDDVLYVGDRNEDEKAAANADVPFIWSGMWLKGNINHALN